jgi:hypothetical protein
MFAQSRLSFYVSLMKNTYAVIMSAALLFTSCKPNAPEIKFDDQYMTGSWEIVSDYQFNEETIVTVKGTLVFEEGSRYRGEIQTKCTSTDSDLVIYRYTITVEGEWSIDGNALTKTRHKTSVTDFQSLSPYLVKKVIEIKAEQSIKVEKRYSLNLLEDNKIVIHGSEENEKFTFTRKQE